MTPQDSLTPLNALTALDGRYHAQIVDLSAYLSEEALIRYRIRVEAAWTLHLSEDPVVGKDFVLSNEVKNRLRLLMENPPENAGPKVKAIEKTTNHDVKAVEYYLRGELESLGEKGKPIAFLHFACTSEDINNLSYAMMLNETRKNILVPMMERITAELKAKAEKNAGIAMLSRTHGQTASPTTLGKELNVFAMRLDRQILRLKELKIEGKMNGAVGNYNAHYSAYPNVDWPKLSRNFIEKRLGLHQNPLTTQIENHDTLVEYCDIVRRFNTIAIGLARDIWGYISLGYFSQTLKEGEVGSSTMPHKVNPIDFENAEGNFGVANALAGHFHDKLLISRWQRDLSDSTVLRTLGTMLGHSLLAMKSLMKGLGKIKPQEAKIRADLDEAWEVLAEPIQTVMRRYGVTDAYERLKAATRGQAVTKEAMAAMIDTCAELPLDEKARLKKLTPSTYIGIAVDLATLHPFVK